MKQRLLNDINALTSGILGFMGMSLLLIPEHMRNVLSGVSTWATLILGILCFVVALSCQIMFALQVRRRREVLIRLSSVLLLVLLGGMFAHSGLFIEGLLLVFLALAQSLPLTPLWKPHFHDKDVLNVIAIAMNVAASIFLLSIRIIPEHAYSIILPYQVPLVAIFLAGAVLGILSFLRPGWK
ncbi:MAG: hypothetical protein AB1649_06805, partial [Chloroflexota bacterium]